MFVDAPLVVRNEKGQRLCETQVGQRYWHWKVSANTTNIHSPRLAGMRFLLLARMSGWRYSDGNGGPPHGGRFISETYPYATLVGVEELGYDIERPRYKRKPRHLPIAQWRTERAANCDTLIRRLGQLADADPPLLLRSHPLTRDLAEQPSPTTDSAYKHREDLIDALLCAWTASLWVAWWGNNDGTAEARAWLDAGWRVESVNQVAGEVVFTRADGQPRTVTRPAAGHPGYIYAEVSASVAERAEAIGLDAGKLARLITELNDNYSRGNAYAAHALLRAILDHIPPLLSDA